MNIIRRSFLTVVCALALCGVAGAQGMGANLVPPASADCVAVRSGSWQTPATWDGKTPQQGDRVFIPAGITVTNHATTADVLWIHAAGTLTCCDHCDTRINVHTLYVPMGGALRLHSTGQCVVEFLPGPFLPGDTNKLSRGLICHGEFMASGVEKTAWTLISDPELKVGATNFNCESANGWQVGDRLIVCGTDSLLGENRRDHVYQSENVTITAIDGDNVTFSPPLKYRHFRWAPDLPFHCANLTRNIVIRSRDASVITNRGHLMFMSSMCRMENVAVEGCGRTDGSQPVTDPRQDVYGELVAGSDANVRARYSVHWHRIGQLSTPAICTGCVVDGSPKWGFLIHDSNVHLRDCIAVRCYGAGFATEEGQERGSFDRCLSVLNNGLGDDLDAKGQVYSSDADHGRALLGDWGIDGSGFWLQGGGVSVTNCVACDNSGRGFALFNRTLNGYPRYGTGNPIPEYLRYPIDVHGTLLGIEYDGRDKTPASTFPMQVFRGNTAYGNKTGVQSWTGPTHNGSGQLIWPLASRGSMTDTTIWGRGAKLNLEYTRQMNVDGLRIIGDNSFRAAYNSLNKNAEAVLLRGAEVTVTRWDIQHVQANMREFAVEGVNDPGGIAAKNLVIEGATVQADGSVTIP